MLSLIFVMLFFGSMLELCATSCSNLHHDDAAIEASAIEASKLIDQPIVSYMLHIFVFFFKKNYLYDDCINLLHLGDLE